MMMLYLAFCRYKNLNQVGATWTSVFYPAATGLSQVDEAVEIYVDGIFSPKYTLVLLAKL